jgi:site-specific recombinase XerD
MEEPGETSLERAVNKLHKEINESDNINDNNKAQIVSYIKVIFNNGLRPSTQYIYMRSLMLFSKYLGNKRLEDATSDDIDEYFQRVSKGQYMKKVPSTATLNLHKRSLMSFYMKLLRLPKGKYPKQTKNLKIVNKGGPMRKLQKKDLITTEDINKMVSVAGNPRDKALIKVLYESAFRVDEFLSMKIGNVDMRGNEATINPSRSKTRIRSVLVILGYPELKEWLKYHPRNDDPDAPLWINKSDICMSNVNVAYVLQKTMKQTGLGKKIYPHLMRHSRITWLYKKGMNEIEIRNYAGWSEHSKMIYNYAHLAKEDVENKQRLLSGVEGVEIKEEMVKRCENCPVCGHQNPLGFSICDKCSSPLSAEKVISIMRERQDLDNLLKRMKEVEPIVRKIVESNSRYKSSYE